MSKLPKVTVKDLVESAVHFGHRAARWNPKMAPYIYGERDGIHIIDLRHTSALMQIALKKVYEVARNNGKILFVGTKVQASPLVVECAEKTGQYHVSHRWLGGTLTNWATISQSIKRLEVLEKKLADEDINEYYTKKEILELERKKDKLHLSFSGVRGMGGKPDLVVVIDTNREHLSIKEAKNLGVPVVAILDTNSDPDNVDYPIPGNDDAIRSIRLYTELFTRAVLAGIEDSLAESGVDIGAVADVKVQNNQGKITKLAASKKAITSKVKVSTSNADESMEKAIEENAKKVEVKVEKKNESQEVKLAAITTEDTKEKAKTPAKKTTVKKTEK